MPYPTPTDELPLVSVVVCTRNRGAAITSTVATILANAYPRFELLVVDQSIDDTTAQALAPFLADPRLRYLPSRTRGLGIARNIGLAAVRGTVVLMTDDDCDVPPDWIARMWDVFAHQPDVTVVFCDVYPGPFDRARGFIPNNVRRKSVRVDGLLGWCMAGGANLGIGAGMGLRRAPVLALGAFDTQLGAGAPFQSAEETDVALRALLHGQPIYRTTTTGVVHHGFRTYDEGRTLVRNYMLGVAASLAKLLKCGYWGCVLVCVCELWRIVLGPMLVLLLTLRRPHVLGRSVALIRGFVQGLRTAVNTADLVFLPVGELSPVVAVTTMASDD